MSTALVDRLFALLGDLGRIPYGSAALSELEHAIQSATLARDAGAGSDMITAALLHDVGHLVVKSAAGDAAIGIDNRHEEIGAAFLSGSFPPTVTEPIRLHVPAKRYLAAVDEVYRAALSPAARRSLARQGGAFDAGQLQAFEALPYAQEAVQLRRWDDLAMVQDLVPAQLHEFRSAAEESLRPEVRAMSAPLATASG